MKILYLASWYPTEMDPFTGDFIQRHARAASLYDEIIVLYVTRVNHLPDNKRIHHQLNTQGKLTEHIIYYRSSKKWKPLDKIISFFTWRRLFYQLAASYLKSTHPPTLAHVQVAMRAGLIALRLKRKYGLPYVLTEHNGIYNNLLPQSFGNQSAWFRNQTRKVFNQSAGFLTVSKSLANDVNRDVIKKSYQIVYNTVDTRYFFFKPIVESRTKFRFIHVSNIIPLKNVEGIIRAFSNLVKKQDAAELVIVGGYYKAVIDLAETIGLLNRSIFFTDEIPYEQVAEQMQNADAMVLFSDTENMPCVALEALCCGIPVISSAVGGLPEILDEKNGMLVPRGNEALLAGAMDSMIRDYKDFNREQISARAKQLFSYETIGRQLHDSYHSF